jgi:hypothetical protein
MDAFKLILVSLAGWMNRQQQHVIEYLLEEVRVLKEQQGSDGRNSQMSRGDAWPARPSRSAMGG